ncbi:M28 family peptidase [Tamlana fucoidanivorans]|uniref:M28 family peptidase n=1 Tax=Allotamlana fucoidanivorans TaxID=2583814 RepID=A0A5C4SHG9_9FLAO|nr:M28 family peptidase [Tamlana fucoidanivorans]TNJ43127.1 M28 family peptidase [Tamlana fucoidanivorans]
MKTIFTLSLLALLGTCATPKYTQRIKTLKNSIVVADSALIAQYSNTITKEELKSHLYTFASGEFEGRKVGEKGQKLAANFLKNYYQTEHIPTPFGANNYYQIVPNHYLSDDLNDSENVLAYIEGKEKPEEVIIISAHLDHLGLSDNGDIYYGADDDGSGNVAIMEMAQAFKLAAKNGHQPKRSILFLHLTAEEIGQLGAEFYTKYPVFELHNTIANLNIDMIGRIDDLHQNNKNYLYLIGSDRLSLELHYLSEKINNTFFNINLDYRYNKENDVNHYYERSDHYKFANKGIPVIFYFNGVHADYHKPSDTPDKIDYAMLEKRTKLIFATAWQIANQNTKLKVDSDNQLLK